MKERLLNNLNRIITFVIVLATVIGFLTITKTNKTTTASLEEIARKVEMTYDVIPNEEEYADEGKSVKFGAFYTQDLNYDSYAEKMLGSCNQVKSTRNMYIEIGVEKEGYLKDGVITINGNNFTFGMEMLRDTVLKKDYISTDIGRIELNEIHTGTQEILIGKVKSKISSGGDYSRNDNTVTLTGTFVSDGGEETPISKTYTLTNDWYGTASTSASSTSSKYLLREFTEGQDIRVSYSFSVKTTGLLSQTMVADISVPALAGFYPTSVSGGTYDAENHTIHTEYSTSSESGTYEITLVYPAEAYGPMKAEIEENNVVNLRSQIIAYSLCYNNPNEGFENPYRTGTSTTTAAINIRAKDSVTTASHECSVRFLDRERIQYPTVTNAMSKKELLEEYDKDEPEDLEYRVEWLMTRTSSNYLATTIDIEDESMLGDSFDDNHYLGEVTYTKAIAFTNSSLIPSDGSINIYEVTYEQGSQRRRLVKSFENGEWEQYTDDNPYVFDTPIKDIRIITSEDVQSEYKHLCIHLTRAFDVAKMKELDMRSTIASARNFKTAATFKGSNLRNNFTVGDTCAFVTQETYAKITANPEYISTAEVHPVNQKFYIDIPSESMSTAKWTNGIFVLEIPANKIAKLHLNSVTSNHTDDMKIVGEYNGDVFEENGKYYIKIFTNSTEFKSGCLITIDTDILPNPIADAGSLGVKLHYLNEECRVYMNQERDSIDINGNGNTTEPIGYTNCKFSISAPNAFVTTETISNYNEENDITVAPNVANVTQDKRQATVNVLFANHYVNSVSNVKVLGKVPFAGNKYVDGDSLNSEFSTTMTNEGIQLPSNLEGKARIYYSTNENPTKDLDVESNGWRISTDWTSLEDVKSYLVVINQNDVKRGNLYNLSYTINIPEGVNSNKVTYSCHKVFFELNTDGGILESSVQPSKLGLRVVNYYDFEIDKCKKGSNLGIQGATYQLLEDEDGEQVNGRMVTSDTEGKMSLTNLKANQIYYFKEIKAPNSCELNEGVIKFRVNEGENGTLSFELLSETSFDGEISFVENASGRKVLRSKVEDLPKVKLIINKIDKESRSGIRGVMFGIESKGSAITDINGKALFTGISVNTPYVLKETQEGKGYYKNNEEMPFIVNFENNVVSIRSDSNVFQNAQIRNTDDSEYIEIEITIENEKIPTYKLNVIKVDEYDTSKKIANTRFLLKNVQYNQIHYYTTDENGTIELSDLYQYVEGRDVTGEYILQEVSPADGYLENYEEIKFVVSKREKEPEEGSTATEPEYELFITVENEDSLLNYGGATAEGDTINLTVTNKPLFKVRKFDSETGMPLANVEFVIYEVDSADTVIDFAKDNNKNYVGTLNEEGVYVVTTDEGGEITAPLRSGRYKLVEYKYLHGYQEEEKVEYFVISGNRQEDEEEFYVPGMETNPYAVLDTKEVGYIEDLVDMQIASDGGENYSRVLFKLTRDLDFEDPSSYRNAQDTSYGDINGNGVVETILEELTNKNGTGFTPIGNVNPFYGIFNGQNHELRNIYINRSNTANAGLFGKVGSNSALYGSVQGLGLTGTIKATNVDNVGAFVATQAGGCRIVSCYNKANITVTIDDEEKTTNSTIAGIGSAVYVERCYNEGNITVTNNSEGAALVSGIGGLSSTKDCYNRGNITISGSGVGKGAGISVTASPVSNCYNTGNVVVEMNHEEMSYAQGIGFALTNSYCLDSITIVGQRVNEPTKTSEEMKAAEFISLIGSSWIQDTNNINDGYPILKNNIVINSIEDLVKLSNDYDYKYEGVAVTLMRTLDFNEDSSYDNPNDTRFGDINEDGNITGIKDELTNTEGKGFIPIGRNSFRGIFDGNGYEINNLYINRQTNGYYGLFNYIQNAHIKDITVSGNIVCGGTYGGGICGYVSSGYSTFENCINKCNISSTYSSGTGGIVGCVNGQIILKGCENYGRIDAGGDQGGLAGYASGPLFVIDTCKNYGDIVSSSQQIGGFVGYCHSSVYTIDSYNYGSIIGNGSYCAGFFGIVSSSSSANIYRSGNEGTVAANGYYIGGFIGECSVPTCIKKSYNSGNIIRTSYTNTVEYVGGLIGRASYLDGNVGIFDSWNSGAINISKGGTRYLEYIGGLVGYGNMNIYSCYNTGDLTIQGGECVGGIAGYVADGLIKDTYNTGKITVIGTEDNDSYPVGGISGQNGSFENCTNKGEIYFIGQQGDDPYVGGISGQNGTFNKVYNDGNILVEIMTGSYNGGTYAYVGGISGQLYNGQVVTDSYNKGNITYKNYEPQGDTIYAGGIIGGGGSGNVTNSYNEGEINVDVLGYYQAYVGGIIGSGNTVSYSYNIGSMTVANGEGNAESIYAGGIAGRIVSVDHSYNTGAISTANAVTGATANNFVGGIAGYKSGNVVYCYNTGDIESTLKADKEIFDCVGGLVGYGGSGTSNNIQNCYNTGNVTSTVTPKTGSTGKYKIATGGVTGYTEGPVQECYNTGKVTNDITMPTSSTEDSYEYIGGVNGYAKTITFNCYNEGQVDNTLSVMNSTNRNEYVYVGGVTGFGKVSTAYNEGEVSNAITSYGKMHSYTGGVVGDADGLVTNAYNKADINNNPTEAAPFAVEYYSGGIAGKTNSISSTYNVGQLTNTYGGYIGSPATHSVTYEGPMAAYATGGGSNYYLDSLTVPEGSVTTYATSSTESFMKDGEMYNILHASSDKWTEVEDDYPTLDLALKDIDVYVAPDLSQKVTEIEVENTKKTYDITTEIKPNTFGLRIGGTITGEHTTQYPEATGIKFVETRKYTESNTVDIVATPEDGYRVTSITINGEEYEFDKTQTTSVTIPAGYFKNIDMNYHVVVTFSPMDEVLEINKVDENGNPLEGAEFSIEQVENRAEPDNSYFGEMTGTGPNYEIIDPSEQPEEIIDNMQQGSWNASSGYYFERQSNGTYRSNNYHRNRTTAGSYMEVDLTGREGTYTIVVNASVSSEKWDSGMAYLTTKDPVHNYLDYKDHFIEINGTENISKDYKTPVLQGGTKYYVCFEYSKNYGTHSGNDRFYIYSVKLYKNHTQSYGFVANGEKYESNNTGNENTKANSSMSLDLRNYRGKYKVTVNAEQSGKNKVDYGKINVTAPGYEGRELGSLNGTVEAQDYSVILDGGRLYSLDFEYSRGAGTDSDHGSDKMTINSINIELDNSDFVNETGLVTDENGKITVALGYGKYKITETKAPEGYAAIEDSIEHTIGTGTNNSISIPNERICDLTAHYYLKGTGPEYQNAPVVIEADKNTHGKRGTPYTTSPIISIGDYTLMKEYDEATQEEKYVIPKNAIGYFGVDSETGDPVNKTDVYYYYEMNDVKYTVHYLYDNVEESTYEGTGKIGEKVDSYPDRSKAGYSLIDEVNFPIEALSSNEEENHIYIHYARNMYKYSIHYYYEDLNGVMQEDTERADKNIEAIFNSEIIKEDIQDNIDKNANEGFTYMKSEALNQNGECSDFETTPLVIGENNDNNRINVYYSRDTKGYEVHYIFDGEDDESLTAHKTAKFGAQISSYDPAPAEKVTGYRFVEAKALDADGNEKDLPLEIKLDESKNRINVYYVSIYTINTEVAARAGTNRDGSADNNKGGTISGENENPYETVDLGGSNTKSIAVEAAEGFVIKDIKVNGNSINYSAYVQRSAAHKVVLPEGYFTNVNENKLVKAEFKKASNVKVRYMVNGTETKLADDIDLPGFEGDSFSTEYKTFTGYKLNSIKDQDSTILTGTNNVISGNMYADELIVTYWYDVDNSGIKEEHILINEDGSTTNIESQDYEGQVGTSKTLNRKTYTNYEAAEGPASQDENVIVVAKTENSKEVEYTSNATKTVRFYYERKDAKVTVHYVEKATNTEISEVTEIPGKAGKHYETTPKTIENYVLLEGEDLPANAEGDFVPGNIDVYYYYVKAQAKITVKHIDITDETEVVIEEHEYAQDVGTTKTLTRLTNNDLIGADAPANVPDGVIVVGKTETSKDVTFEVNKDKEIRFYYVKAETIIRERHIDIATGEELPIFEKNHTGVVGTDITFVRYPDEGPENFTEDYYEAVDGPEVTDSNVIVAGKDDASITETFERDVIKEVRFYYSRRAGRITVKYVDNLTGESVKPDYTIDGKVGDEYSVTAAVIPGYKLDETKIPDYQTSTIPVGGRTIVYTYIKLRPYELFVRYTVDNGDNDQAKFMVRFGDTTINEYTTNGLLKVADIELTDLGTETYTLYETETPEYCTTILSETDPAIVELIRRLNTEERKYEFVSNYEDRNGFDVTIDDDNKKIFFDVKAIKNEKYDLAIRKFITKIGEEEITDREPKVEVSEDNKITYVGNDKIEKAINNQNITYTIRMYNESDVRARGKRVIEYIPDGLVFDANNEVNKQWTMCKIDENGKAMVTDNPDEATIIVTDCLVGKDIPAFNTETKEVSFIDVQAVFKVNEKKITRADRIIENKVEIMKNNNDDNHDNDISTEKVYVKYFDLSIEKYIESVTVNTNGTEKTTEIGYAQKGKLAKFDVKRSEVNNTKLTVTYGMVVKNIGEIPGYATELTDYVPENFKLIDDGSWTLNGNTAVSTSPSNKVINPGESETVFITFEWNLAEGNIGTRRNEAEITAYTNDFGAEDITKDNKDGEDLLVAIKTGSEVLKVASTFVIAISIVALGVVFIKRKVVIRKV